MGYPVNLEFLSMKFQIMDYKNETLSIMGDNIPKSDF